MEFKRFLIVLLAALVVTVMGINLSAVEETTSPIESFWSSIPTQYKTRLKVYDEKGRLAYVIELLLANETTLGEERANMVPFIAGIEPEKSSSSAFLLYYIYPGSSSLRKFIPHNLIITISNGPSIYLQESDVRGYLISDPIQGYLDALGDSCPNCSKLWFGEFSVSVNEPMPGVFRMERTEKG